MPISDIFNMIRSLNPGGFVADVLGLFSSNIRKLKRKELKLSLLHYFHNRAVSSAQRQHRPGTVRSLKSTRGLNVLVSHVLARRISSLS